MESNQGLSNSWFNEIVTPQLLNPPIPRPVVETKLNNGKDNSSKLSHQEIKEWDLAIFDFFHQNAQNVPQSLLFLND